MFSVIERGPAHMIRVKSGAKNLSYTRFRLQRKFAHFQAIFPIRLRRIGVVLLSLFALQGVILFFLRPTTVDAAWYNSTWSFRKLLTIQESKVSGSSNHTDFPVLVSLTDPELKASAQSDGDDILFTSGNGTTKLDHEIEKYDSASGELVAWVEIPTLDHNDNTPIYLYYGNAAASSQQNATATWNSNYTGIWHMKESSGNVIDSTTNAHTGTANGTTATSGKLGSARSFNGSSDYIQVTDHATLDMGSSQNFTISMWINSTQAASAGQYPSFLNKEHSAPSRNGYEWYLHGDVSNDWDAGIYVTGTGYPSGESANIADGNWHYIVFQRSGSTLYTYRNGSEVNNTPASSADLSNTADLYMGRWNTATHYYAGKEDEVRIAKIAHSPDWITTEYNNQSDPTSFFTASTQQTQRGPVLQWGFDEGTGSTTNDSTTFDNDGTISGATWQTEEMCVNGKCLKFDGSNDYTRKTYASDSELDTGSTGFSVSAWFKHPTTISGTDIIIARTDSLNGVGYKLYYDATNGVCFGIDGSAGSFPSDSACTTTSHADNQWHYIEGIKSGTSSITLYIDGKQVAQDASLTANGSISGTSSPFYVGLDADGSSNPWDGFIDDVKYYDYERSAAQIKADYMNDAAVVLGAQDTSFLNDGLAGYWKMDESSWASTCASTPVTDSSGNGNNGNACPSGSAATVAAGKFANAGSFDGTNDYVTLGNSAALYTPKNNQWTMAAWINPTDFTENSTIFRKDGGGSGYFIRCASSTGTFDSLLAHSGGFSQQSGGTCTAGVWQHVAMTYDGKTRKHFINGVMVAEFSDNITLSFETTNAVVIGAGSVADTSENFKGKIDEIRAYNRYLTDSEISSLYNWAPSPLALWKFDDGSGQTIADGSGNGYSGTLGTSSSVETDDASWAVGKYGGGLLSDGTTAANFGTHVSSLNISEPATFMGWYRGTNDDDTIFYGIGSVGNPTFRIDIGNNVTGTLTNELITILTNTTGGTAVNRLGYTTATRTELFDGNWHHIAVTSDGSAYHIYIDGIEKTITVGSGSNNGDVGPMSGANFIVIKPAGVFDDFKIYNYTRTIKQITSDINGGHPSVGSPVASALGHWSFDEGKDNSCSGGTNDFCNSGSGGTAYDAAQNNMASPPTSTSGWTNSGKFGKGVNLDGSNDFVQVSGLMGSPTSVTVGGWAKLDTIDTGSEFISIGDYFTIRLDAAGEIWCIYHISTNNWDNIHVATTYEDTGWHHFACSFDDTANIQKLYVDGKEIGSDNQTSSIQYSAQGSNTIFGKHANGGTTRDFGGTIDEIKIYSYAMSGDEIKVDFNQGKSQVMGAVSTASDGITPSNDATRAYCPPGNTETNCGSGNPAPLGEWLFDESTGTTANDTSGNGNTMTLSKASWNTGKIGYAWLGDSSNWACTGSGSCADNNNFDFVGADNFSISFWYKSNSATNPGSQQHVIAKTPNSNAGYRLRLNTSGRMLFEVESGTDDTFTDVVGTTGTDTYDATWHFVTARKSGTSSIDIYIDGELIATDSSISESGSLANTNPLYIGERIGADGSDEFDGSIDQVRIYNYLRTPAQIAWDYNRGAPTGYWQFDECTGTTVYDASGNGRNGTINPGASGNTAAGTCNSGTSTEMWNDGTTGKFNGSLGFDNTNDYVNIASPNLPTTDYSYSVWFTSAGTSDTIISVSDGSGGDELRIRKDSTNTIEVKSNNSVVLNTLSNVTGNGWHHLVVTRSGSTISGYIDGKLESTATDGTAYNFSTCDLLIGTDVTSGCAPGTTSAEHDGLIDDVRVYHYALSPVQVRLLYNQNSAIRFGPSTGAP